MSAGIVTLLFTDLVGSTALLDQLGDDAFDALRRRHFQSLRSRVAAHGGTEVKSLGDGLMVTIPSVVDAIECAIGIQREADSSSGIAVRVGLHVGEPIHEEDDYFGTSVVVARRLCDRAGAHQIYASALVRELAGSRGGFSFTPLGELELKGLSNAVSAFEISYERSPSASLPAVLADLASQPFVGREEVLNDLQHAWKESSESGIRLALIAGEPGIGKTRLAAQIAKMAGAQRATVLYGRADEDNLVPYQPFVEALTSVITSLDEAGLQSLVGASLPDLARLVPDLTQRLPSPANAHSADADVERYLMFEAAASLLASLAERAPVLLVLDDLHWTDGATLRLLRHLLRHSGRHRLMVVGTYRDTDLDRSHPLAAVLADLRRESSVTRHLLHGLTEAEIRDLLEELGDQALDEQGVALAGSLRRETEGNPFFIREVVRHLVETGVLYQRDGRWVSDLAVGDIGIPEGVREVIGRRLSRLDERTNSALAAGAILGREFTLSDLVAVTSEDVDGLIELLESAVAAAVVTEVPGCADRWTFTHALVRQTLVQELSAARRVRLHRRAAAAIEARADAEEHLAELARHHAESGDPDGKVADYARRAASSAMNLLAREEALRLYDLALDAIEPGEHATRARLLVERAAAVWGQGTAEEIRAAGDLAVAAAREVGDPELLAEAALVAAGGSEAGLNDASRRGALLEALEGLPPVASPARARVLARLGMATIVPAEGMPADAEASLKYAAEAARIAADNGDPALIADVARSTMYVDGFVSLAPPEVRLANAYALRDRARTLGDPVLECVALGWIQGAHMANFDTARAADALDEYAALAERTRRRMDRYFAVAWRVAHLTFIGDLVEAHRLNTEVLTEYGPGGWEIVPQAWGAIEFIIRRWIGGLEGLIPAVEANASDPRFAAQWCVAYPYLLAEVGRLDEARREFDRLDVAGLRTQGNAAMQYCLVALTADALDAAEAGNIAAPFLEERVGQNMNVGFSAHLGSASHFVALARRASGEFERAEAQFRRAIEENGGSGARPWLAETQYELAKLLSARGDGDDETAALLAEALATCEELGMDRLAGKVSALAAG